MFVGIPRLVRIIVVPALIAGALIALIQVGAFRGQIVSYRVVDGDLVFVRAVTSPFAWVLVKDYEETPSAITVDLRSIAVPFPGIVTHEAAFILSEALGSRAVIDASTGQAVPFLDCPPHPVTPDCQWP